MESVCCSCRPVEGLRHRNARWGHLGLMTRARALHSEKLGVNPWLCHSPAGQPFQVVYVHLPCYHTSRVVSLVSQSVKSLTTGPLLWKCRDKRYKSSQVNGAM